MIWATVSSWFCFCWLYRGSASSATKNIINLISVLDFPRDSDSMKSAYKAGDPGSILGLGRSPVEGNGKPLQYSCLENPMDEGAWWAAICGVSQSRTRLKQLSSSSIIPWRRKWQTTPVFLPGRSHGQWSLVGCSLWGCKESDMTEWLSTLYIWSWFKDS